MKKIISEILSSPSVDSTGSSLCSPMVEERGELSWLDFICERLIDNDPNLREVEIDPNDSEEFDDSHLMKLSDSLRKNTVVACLTLRNLNIGIDGAMYLTPMLKNSKSLTTLQMEDTRGEGQVAVALALALNTNCSLKIVHLKANWIDSKSASSLGMALTSNTSLAELRLCHNRIDHKSAAAIAQGLRSNTGLRILDLLGNAMDDVSVSHVAGGLEHNSTLEFLCLDFNQFGNKGVQALAKMLKTNTGVKELHLFGNHINPEGAEFLAEALYNNVSLQSLILSFNQIGDRGASALAEALTVNSTLRKIWFPSNCIGNDGLQAFAEHLPKMRGLEQLNVGDFFDNVGAQALLEGLKLNMRLHALYLESPVYDDEWMDQEMDFYLRLNKSGRRLLRENSIPTGLWPTVFARSRAFKSDVGSPDVLYSLLRQKPELLEC